MYRRWWFRDIDNDVGGMRDSNSDDSGIRNSDSEDDRMKFNSSDHGSIIGRSVMVVALQLWH